MPKHSRKQYLHIIIEALKNSARTTQTYSPIWRALRKAIKTKRENGKPRGSMID